MAVISLPYFFTPLTSILSSQVNANFSTIVGGLTANLDSTNISQARGIGANYITAAGTGASGAFQAGAYSFSSSSAGTTPLTLNGASGQASNLLAVNLFGASSPAVWIDQNGVLNTTTTPIFAGVQPASLTHGDYLDVSATANTKLGTLTVGGLISSTNVTLYNALNVGPAGTTSAGVAGDASFGRAFGQGQISIGSTNSNITIDYGLTTVGQVTTSGTIPWNFGGTVTLKGSVGGTSPAMQWNSYLPGGLTQLRVASTSVLYGLGGQALFLSAGTSGAPGLLSLDFAGNMGLAGQIQAAGNTPAVFRQNQFVTGVGVQLADTVPGASAFPNKWLRVDHPTGNFQIVNNAYSTVIFNLQDNGVLSLANTLNVPTALNVGTANFTTTAGDGSFNRGNSAAAVWIGGKYLDFAVTYANRFTFNNGAVVCGDGATGGSIQGSGLYVSGDISAVRPGGATGVVYFTSGNNRYLFFDGTNFRLSTDVGYGLILDTVYANRVLVGEGLPNQVRGYSFQGDGGSDTGMFSQSDGDLFCLSNNVTLWRAAAAGSPNVNFGGAINASAAVITNNGQGGNAALQVVGDVWTNRGNNTGVIYLGNSLTNYLFFDGNNYNMPNGGLLLNNRFAVTTTAGTKIQAGNNAVTFSSAAVSNTITITMPDAYPGTFQVAATGTTSTIVAFNAIPINSTQFTVQASSFGITLNTAVSFQWIAVG